MITLFPTAKSFAFYRLAKETQHAWTKLNCFKPKLKLPQLLFFPELVVFGLLPFSSVGLSFIVLVKTQPLRNLKLRSALPLGRFDFFVYVSPAVQAFYPPTTTLLNFHIYPSCYVQRDTRVSWDCKFCSANYSSLPKFEWQSYSCSAT
jgi:hypothetical protein